MTQLPDRYNVLQSLGSGASGEVLLARDRETERRVAIKRFHDRIRLSAEAQGEIASLSKLSHPRIVTLLDHDVAADPPYIVFEYAEGLSLSAYVAQAPPASEADVRFLGNLWLQLLGALDHLHAAGLIHRDLKEDNIRLQYCGEPPMPEGDLVRNPYLKVKLLDLGFVRNRDHESESQGNFKGTLGYAAPEQIRSAALGDERSDLFSVGVIVYRSLTGSLPFADLNALLSGAPPLPVNHYRRETPPALSALISTLLAPSPYARPASAAEAAHALEAALFSGTLAFLSDAPYRASGGGVLRPAELYGALAKSITPLSAPSEDLLKHLLEQTGGLPELCAAYAADLLKCGRLTRRYGELALVDDGAAPTLSDTVSTHVSDIVNALRPDESAFLLTAACLGEFALEEAAVLLRQAASETESLRRRLSERGLIGGADDRWSLRAKLVAAYLREVAPAVQIADIQRRIVALRAHSAPAAVLARHLAEAGRPEEAFVHYLSSIQREQDIGRGLHLLNDALALPYRPTSEQAATAAGMLLAFGQPRRARALLDTVLEDTGADAALLAIGGRAELRCGDFAAARECFSRAMAQLDPVADHEACLESLRGLAAACRSLGQLDEADAAYRRMAQLSHAEEDPRGRIEALNGTALVARERGNFAAAERSLRQAHAAAESLGDRRRAAIALNNLGNVLRAMGKHDQAAACVRQAIAARKALGDPHGLAIAYNSLAQDLRDRGDMSAALEAIDESHRLFLTLGDRKGQAITLINRGAFLGLRGRIDEALAALRRATALAARLGDEGRALQGRLAAAGLLLLHDDREAERLLEAVLDSALATPRLSAQALSILATLHLRRGDLEKARQLCERAHTQLQQAPNPDELAELYGVMSEILLAQGDAEGSLEKAQEGYDLLPPEGVPLTRGRLSRILGEAWREMGPLWADRTERHLKEAEQMLSGVGYRLELARTYAAWARYLSYLGEVKESLRQAEAARQIFLQMGAAWDAAQVERFMKEVS